jgi:hypothetical protein
MKKLIFAVAFLLAACGTQPIPNPTSNPPVTPTVSNSPVTCQPTDQDQYVYSPDRLTIKLPCLRVVGTVDFVRVEADGDYHLGLKLDPAYQQYVNSCNSTCVGGAEHGDLVIEPICANPVTQADAIASCKADPDPLKSIPSVGQHVWMEGRYVLDMDHGGWAELHPLYRWGVA